MTNGRRAMHYAVVAAIVGASYSIGIVCRCAGLLGGYVFALGFALNPYPWTGYGADGGSDTGLLHDSGVGGDGPRRALLRIDWPSRSGVPVALRPLALVATGGALRRPGWRGTAERSLRVRWSRARRLGRYALRRGSAGGSSAQRHRSRRDRPGWNRHRIHRAESLPITRGLLPDPSRE